VRVNTYLLDKTFEADSDLSSYQHMFVKPTTGVAYGPMARVTLCESGHGFVLQNKPKAIKQGAVLRIYGFSELVVDGTAGGGISVGSYIKPTTGGKGVAASAGDYYSAIAFEASAANNDKIEVLCERGILHV
jgi:hypothetical protein